MARRQTRRRQDADRLAEDVAQHELEDAMDEGNFNVRDANFLDIILTELADREKEALKIYEELPKATAFHRSRKSNRIVRGSNRAGKTLSAAVEMARAVTGQDPYGKYPKEDGVAFIFGRDGKHIGSVIYKKLFMPGAFKIIKDADTGKWRVFKPWLDGDRADEAKKAPPLIPPRFVEEWAWEDKKGRVPKSCRLINGWELYFYSSLGELPQGQDIDLWWIDEEVDRDNLLEELFPRVADRAGRGFWSATPQVASGQLYDLHERAEDKDPDVEEIHLLIAENPYIPQEEKDKLWRAWTPEQRRVRWYGEYAYTQFVVYPEFSMETHGIDMGDGWQVPLEWAIYASIDPGRQVCATLFLAVPPIQDRFDWIIFDELYIEQCDAQLWGKRFSEKTRGRILEAGIMDKHGGGFAEMGSGKTVEFQYRQALIQNGVTFRDGVAFHWGNDDIDGRIESVRGALSIRANGSPRVRVVHGRCPNLEREFKRYKYKKVRDRVSDVPEAKNNHLMDCLGYIIDFSPVWRKPRGAARTKSPAVKALEAKRARAKAKGNGENMGVVSLS